MMTSYRHCLAGCLVAGGLLGLGGCEDRQPEFKTVTLSGTVEQIELGRSRVRISYFSDKHRRTVTTEAVVTSETEIFINGSLARLQDVRVGERAEGEAVVTRGRDGRVITVKRVQIHRSQVIKPAQEKDEPAATTAPGGDLGG